MDPSRRRQSQIRHFGLRGDKDGERGSVQFQDGSSQLPFVGKPIKIPKKRFYFLVGDNGQYIFETNFKTPNKKSDKVR